jgi:hypothetical protein
MAPILEFEPGARDEIFDRARHEHFARLRVRGDPRTDVDGDSADLAVDELTLSRV